MFWEYLFLNKQLSGPFGDPTKATSAAPQEDGVLDAAALAVPGGRVVDAGSVSNMA